MKRPKQYLSAVLPGLGYSLLPLLLSVCLIRNLDGLFHLIGGVAGLNMDTLEYGGQVLNQLKDASVRLPWLLAPVIAATAALLLYWGWRGTSVRRTVVTVLAIALLLPLTLVFAWLTEVNGIQLGALLARLLPLLPVLL